MCSLAFPNMLYTLPLNTLTVYRIDSCCSEILCGLDWWLVNDVSRQPIGSQLYRELCGRRSVLRKRDSPPVFIIPLCSLFSIVSFSLTLFSFSFFFISFCLSLFSFTFPHPATGGDFMFQGRFPLTLLVSVTLSKNQSPLTAPYNTAYLSVPGILLVLPDTWRWDRLSRNVGISYQSTLRNISEERRSQLHGGTSLKSRILYRRIRNVVTKFIIL